MYVMILINLFDMTLPWVGNYILIEKRNWSPTFHVISYE